MYNFDSILIKAGEDWDYGGGGIYHSNHFDFETNLGGIPALFISICSDQGIKVRWNPSLPDPGDREFTLNAGEIFNLDKWECEVYDLRVKSLQGGGGADTTLRIMAIGFDPGSREVQAT